MIKYQHVSGTSFDLSKTLCISFEKNEHGHFIRITRANRWICLSTPVWNDFCRNIDIINKNLLHKTESKIGLTKDKTVSVVTFKDQFYVSFSQISSSNSNIYIKYINFNESEWSALLYTIPAIKSLQQDKDVPDTLLPETDKRNRDKLSDCTHCHGKLSAVITHGNLMHQTTKLKENVYKNVRESNETAYNQMAYLCTYCGKSICDDCHCHRWDCKLCEPDNFCDKCEEIVVYKSKYSDL